MQLDRGAFIWQILHSLQGHLKITVGPLLLKYCKRPVQVLAVVTIAVKETQPERLLFLKAAIEDCGETGTPVERQFRSIS